MRRLTLALILAALTLVVAPAAHADHGHNCVWSSGQWIGQGLCPGMPGFEWHTDPPTPEPEPTAEPTTPEPTQTETPAPAPTTSAPVATTPPVTPSPAPTSPPVATTTPPATPAPTRTPGCLRSYGNTWCTGGATPAAVPVSAAPVTGPSVETDIPRDTHNLLRGW